MNSRLDTGPPIRAARVTGGGFFLAGMGVMTFHMRILWPVILVVLGVALLIWNFRRRA